MAVTRTPREAWIDAALRALADGGPEAVRIESLAEVLSVTKGGFYWQFGDRDALLDEMLDTWEHVVIDEAIQVVEGAGGDARTKLRNLYALGRSGKAESRRTKVTSRSLLKIDLAIRDWARRDKAVARRLRRVDNRRMEYLRSLFSTFCKDEAEVEVRCLSVMTLFVGSPFIVADHGARSREAVLKLALEKLLA